jgi:phospholipid transport system substrate-binding protein
MASRPSTRPLTRRGALTAAAGLLAAAAPLAAASGWATRALAADEGAEAFIDRLGQKTLAILKDAGQSDKQKVASLKELLNRSTDLQYVARVIMGQHWRRATDAQKAKYLQLFDALVLETMAERIGSYAGQTFKVTGSRKVDEQDTVVSSQIAQPSGGPSYSVDWRVRKTNARHQLIDIVAEGVSLVITQRSEVNELVNRSGVDGLLAEMQRRIDQRNAAPQVPLPKGKG